MKHPVRKSINLAAAVLVTGGLVYAGFNGAGPLPPLGPAFNPGTGVWTLASANTTASSDSLKVPGLQQPVQIVLEKNGIAHINAKTDHDLFLAMGYLHAHYRLDQMDLMRRLGEGKVSQIVGEKALSSDEFELQLGLQRTAEAEWKQMSQDDPARQALLAYTQGVNDGIQSDEKNGTLPVLFKMLGYKPAKWTPIDSLVIQGNMTQTLDFTTAPLDYALLVKSLGYQQTMDWFPVVPKDTQQPYDAGPYAQDGTAPMESQAGTTVSVSTSADTGQVSNAEINAVTDLLDKIRHLPSTAIHQGSNSNNWAVSGSKTASGQAMMAGDPHLSQTLPSIWYEVAGDSPSYHYDGVSIPGLPGILIGKNQHISWSLTNVQNQATLFYQEKTDAAHPGEYYWDGQWRKMKDFHYTIPIKGGKPVNFTVQTTVHGPIMTDKGQTMSVDWMGALPSPDMDVLLNIQASSNFQQFKSALSQWHAPSQNFVYADDKGNIGLISAGYYPIVKSGNPWLPLSGTGASDIVGTIPYADVPQSYNPPSGIVFSANQREVGPDYPYYIGTSLDFFANGYRADEIQKTLSQGSNLTAADMVKLQNNTTDYLATEMVPKLLTALQGQTLSPQEQAAEQALSNWNEQMTTNSAAASVWWTFWTSYLQDTFGPWWSAKQVPVAKDADLAINPNLSPLDEDLEAWTLSDPTNPVFTPPSGQTRTADDVMRQAFSDAVKSLSGKLGSNATDWQWGKLHAREFDSVAQIASLGFGPKASSGDDWTVDAADSSNGYLSTAGPSWRFVMDWSSGQGIGVYPGGQSENPVSPWYENFVNTWWNGEYLPMLDTSQATKAPGHVVWNLKG